ncbi:MAG: tyrosine-protein phosphatase [Proteobacteria bacterium]|nr:tyrosine-protein phosphatase [Pseudomonadota bacterium]
MSSLALQGAPNFRDIGGYRGADGRTVRSGRLFRSEALARLTDVDLDKLAILDIGLLCDLRAADERQREPNRWPPALTTETLSGMESDELAAVRFFGWRRRIADPSFDAAAARQWILQAYGGMPRLFASLLVSLFDRLAAPDSPTTLIHCTAGKDRTGFVCAALLFALGVSRDDIFDNYLLTRRRHPPEALLQVLVGDTAGSLPAETRAALMTMADVREDYLGTALITIDQDFGGIAPYLETACALHPEKRDRLRNQLLLG